MSYFTVGFMVAVAFFCGMAVERGETLIGFICALCVIGAPYVMEEPSPATKRRENEDE